jgi:hypothetical protein
MPNNEITRPQRGTKNWRFDLTKRTDETQSSYLCQIVRLRLVVGYIGEKSQHNWWASESPPKRNPVYSFPTTA